MHPALVRGLHLLANLAVALEIKSLRQMHVKILGINGARRVSSVHYRNRPPRVTAVRVASDLNPPLSVSERERIGHSSRLRAYVRYLVVNGVVGEIDASGLRKRQVHLELPEANIEVVFRHVHRVPQEIVRLDVAV